MKDFIKIFLVLTSLVVAFIGGRNYGEQTVLESAEYKTNRDNAKNLEKSETELKQIKEKFQNLLESADLKKADEVLSQVMTLFLVDLGLHISEQKQQDFNATKAKILACEFPNAGQVKSPALKYEIEKNKKAENKINEYEEEKTKKWSKLEEKKFKSTEWLVQNANNNQEITDNLKKLQITDLDAYLKGAPAAPLAKIKNYFGEYRGAVIDTLGKNYGSLVMTVSQTVSDTGKDLISGSIKLFRNGHEEASSGFDSSSLGYMPTGYSGLVVELGSRYLQVYKLQGDRRIAGNFYEHAPNGTTRLIGSFVLNRTDQF